MVRRQRRSDVVHRGAEQVWEEQRVPAAMTNSPRLVCSFLFDRIIGKCLAGQICHNFPVESIKPSRYCSSFLQFAYHSEKI